MKKTIHLLIFLLFYLGFINTINISAQKSNDQTIKKTTVTFPSMDGILISADIYTNIEKSNNSFILLCHQAGFSRGEYNKTAKILANNGFTCVAIDQRSGNKANGIINETAKRAKEQGLSRNYINAKQDIEAAIDYVYTLSNNTPIIIVGSSYSASLVLLLAKNSKKVKAVAAFSPGEYLKGININSSIQGLNKPVFVTSTKNEIKKTVKLLKGNISKNLTHFKPSVKGIHGSRSLWKSTTGNENYWDAFLGFLNTL